MNVHGLVQLCQTTQPFYSHSLGIDAAIKRGALRSPDALSSIVCEVLSSAVGPADGVASGIAFRAARSNESADLPALCNLLNSEKLPADYRLASVQMGSRLWEMSRRWDWSGPVHAQFDPLLQRSALHHAIAFGTLISETTASEVRAIAAYLFNIARSIVTAAVRAIPLTDSDGDHVMSQVQPTIGRLATQCAAKSPADVTPIPARWNINEPPMHADKRG
jgi:urease accessory protein